MTALMRRIGETPVTTATQSATSRDDIRETLQALISARERVALLKKKTAEAEQIEQQRAKMLAQLTNFTDKQLIIEGRIVTVVRFNDRAPLIRIQEAVVA